MGGGHCGFATVTSANLLVCKALCATYIKQTLKYQRCCRSYMISQHQQHYKIPSIHLPSPTLQNMFDIRFDGEPLVRRITGYSLERLLDNEAFTYETDSMTFLHVLLSLNSCLPFFKSA